MPELCPVPLILQYEHCLLLTGPPIGKARSTSKSLGSLLILFVAPVGQPIVFCFAGGNIGYVRDSAT